MNRSAITRGGLRGGRPDSEATTGANVPAGAVRGRSVQRSSVR